MQETFNFSSEQTETQQGDITVQASEDAVTRSNFWIAADQYYQSALVVAPSANDQSNRHVLNVYDATGVKVNKLTIQFPKASPGMFELDAVCGDCKVTAGMRQAHLEVISAPGTKHYCIINSVDNDLNMTPVQSIGQGSALFFPLCLSEQSRNILTAHSTCSPESNLKCRLYTGTRAPEMEFRIPARGASCLHIEEAFQEYLELDGSREIQGYLRVVSNSSAELQVSLMEKKYKRQLFEQEVIE